MVTQVQCGYPILLDGGTYNGLLGRTQLIAPIWLAGAGAAARGGVLPSGGQMLVTTSSGMTVTVATGFAICPSSAGSTNGAYQFGSFAPAALTAANADPTNPRIDLISAFVSDVGSSASISAVEILTGTPTPGAALSNLTGAPAVPPNGIALAYILVPAGSSSVTSGNISNVGQLTVAQGGILPVTAASAPAGYAGQYIHDPVSGRLEHNPPSGPAQPHLLPWQMQSNTKNSNTSVAPSSTATIASLTINTTGVEDVEIVGKWPGIQQGSPTNSGLQILVQIDSTQIDGLFIATFSGMPASIGFQGGSIVTRVSVVTGSVPAAGSHTVLLRASNGTSSGNPIVVLGSATTPVSLTARPVCL